ncbi:MAG: hypothetical protein HFJ52_07915 [Clostridia bacterium]|jgi:hypothetical protein|nr:hypothetical protein [Clostridia bacterium]
MNKTKTLKTKEEVWKEYLLESIKQSEEDFKNGRVMTIEESIERMRKKYEGFNIG